MRREIDDGNCSRAQGQRAHPQGDKPWPLKYPETLHNEVILVDSDHLRVTQNLMTESQHARRVAPPIVLPDPGTPKLIARSC